MQVKFPDLSLEVLGKSGWNCLHTACQYENAELVKWLLDAKKANPNALTKDKWSPLHIASHIGSYVIVETILQDSRTNINVMPSIERGTPLHVAALQKNP